MGPTEDLFEGQPSGMPEPMPRGRALYQPAVGEPAKVRHVGGYAPFIEYCTGHGVSAEELASDPERLISFLRTFGSHFENDSTLNAAAAVFAGNAIAERYPVGSRRWSEYALSA